MCDVKIVYDCIEAAVQSALALDPDIHIMIPDGPWIREVRRRTGLPQLFVYYHLVTDVYVVAGWAIPPGKYGKGVAIELEAFKGHPDHLDSGAPSIGWMVQRTTFQENPYQSMQRRLRRSHDRRKALQEQVRNQTTEMLRSII